MKNKDSFDANDQALQLIAEKYKAFRDRQKDPERYWGQRGSVTKNIE